MIPGSLAMMASPGGIVSTDSFNRANGALSGSSLDNANGGYESNTWSVYLSAAWTIASNQVVSAIGIANIAMVSSTAVVGIQRVSIISQSTNGGAIARWATGSTYGHGYLFYRNAGVGQLYRFDGATAAQLGSNGATTIVNGDTMQIYCNGTTITCYLNGVSQISVTDATYATGIPAIYGPASTSEIMDNFKYEVE